MIRVQLSEISEVIQVCLLGSLRWILSFVLKLLSPVPSNAGGRHTNREKSQQNPDPN